jgi:hypothetical protein
MKKTFALVLSLFTAAFLFASCDDLTTVDIPFSLQTEHTMAVAGNDLSIDTSLVVDLTTNTKFNDNKSKLDAVGIDSIAIMITDNTSLSTTQTLEGTLIVANADGTNEVVLHTMSPLNISATQALTANGNWLKIAISQEGKDRLASLIKNSPHSAKLTLRGTTNEAPIGFNANFKIWWAMNATTELI